VLARGYALVRDADGLPVRSAAAAAQAARFQLQFADGAIFARPEDAPDDPVARPLAGAPPSPRPKRAPRRTTSESTPKAAEAAPQPPARQGSLF